MARMLFVTWKDGSPPSQFSVPTTTTLNDILTGDAITKLDNNTEIWIELLAIRTAYLIDTPEGTTIRNITHSSPTTNE